MTKIVSILNTQLIIYENKVTLCGTKFKPVLFIVVVAELSLQKIRLVRFELTETHHLLLLQFPIQAPNK